MVGLRSAQGAHAMAASISVDVTQPLLTIAIPTYNRSKDLALLLGILLPQLSGHPQVELIISDNASPDDTEQVVQQSVYEGHSIRYIRHAANIGADANFVSCFNASRGRYFWLVGDDEIILPGAIDKILGHLLGREFDMVYVASYGFRTDFLAEQHGDPFGRHFHTITSARQLATVVNVMFTFISGIIVNKMRLQEVPHEDPSAFAGTNLIQLSWVLPLLAHHRRSLVLWERFIAGRQGNSGGYSIGRVFGEKLVGVCQRCLPNRPDLARIITNYTVRRFLPNALYEHRRDGGEAYKLSEAGSELREAYGGNWRYWVFVWPVLRLPLSLAALWVKAGVAISKLVYAVSVPGFWRKQT